MAQVVVRRLEDDVKTRLQRLARQHGRSTEEEIREILRLAVRDDSGPRLGLGSRLAARFGPIGLTQEIEEHHGQRVRSPGFAG